MDIEKMTDAIRCIQTSINNDTCDIMDIDMLDNVGKALELQQQEIERLKGDQWISVEDRLPLIEGHYLVHTPRSFPKNCKYQIGELYSDDNSWYNESDDYLDDVTHWCELPKAPEVG